MSKIRRGLSLASQSWHILRSHKGLLSFPLVGGLITLVLVGPPVAAAAYLWDTGDEVPGVLLLALGVYFGSFVGAFTAVALASAANAAMRGEPVSLGTGVSAAMSKLGAIAGWALVNAVLTVILRALESRGELAAIAAALVGGAWSVISLLAVPAIAFEGLGPIGAIKRSTSIFRKQWGGQVSGMAAIGIGVFFCGVLPAAAIIAVGVIVLSGGGSDSFGFGAVLIGVGAVILAIALLISSALRQVFAVALYRFATEGKAPEGFSQEDLESAIRVRGQRKVKTA